MGPDELKGEREKGLDFFLLAVMAWATAPHPGHRDRQNLVEPQAGTSLSRPVTVVRRTAGPLEKPLLTSLQAPV